MMKRQSLIALLLILALLLSACGSAAAPAAEVAEEAEGVEENSYEKLPDEAYEAVPYTLFPAPDGGYVGDVMPFVTDDGTLELYYLYDTDNNGQG